MSATTRTLTWSVVVADYEHWTAERLAAADADTTTVSYDDYAVSLVAEAMHEAGQAVVDANPDLFAVKDLI